MSLIPEQQSYLKETLSTQQFTLVPFTLQVPLNNNSTHYDNTQGLRK